MNDDYDSGDDSGSILDRAKDAIGNAFGGSDSDDYSDTAGEDSSAFGGTGTYGGTATQIGADSSDYGTDDAGFGGDTTPLGGAAGDYGTDMGGGATDTGSAENFDENAGVRSAYDPTTDSPGNFSSDDDNNSSF
jgi:hypothetical protein